MNEPRKLAEILQDYFANSNEPFAVAFREHFGISNPNSNAENTNESTTEIAQNDNDHGSN